MKTKDLTPELESNNTDYTDGTVIFTHPMLDDCYARIRINFDGWRPEQWQYTFDPLWSSDDDFNLKELEKAAKEFWAEKVAEYEEEEREQDGWMSNPYEMFGVNPEDFY